MAGATLVTIAGFTWLFVLPQHLRGHAENPYAGIILFVILPVVFVLGLALIPVGAFLARRRIRTGLRRHTSRQTEFFAPTRNFLVVATIVNLIIGTQLTYRAVEHMETVQFCGSTCHVMKPEFSAHPHADHAGVVPWSAMSRPVSVGGWKEDERHRQLWEVMTNSYPRPIPSAMESNRLVRLFGDL